MEEKLNELHVLIDAEEIEKLEEKNSDEDYELETESNESSDENAAIKATAMDKKSHQEQTPRPAKRQKLVHNEATTPHISHLKRVERSKAKTKNSRRKSQQNKGTTKSSWQDSCFIA